MGYIYIYMDFIEFYRDFIRISKKKTSIELFVYGKLEKIEIY